MAAGARGRLGLEGDDRRVGRVLAAVEVGDVVDQAEVVLEDALQAAGVGTLDGVGAGLVDLGGDGVVLDSVDELAGRRAARRG